MALTNGTADAAQVPSDAAPAPSQTTPAPAPAADAQAWMQAVPESVRSYIKDAPDPAAALKALAERVPVIPDSADAYSVKAPEGLEYDKAQLAEAQAWAKEQGLTPKQFQAVVAYRDSLAQKHMEEYNTARKQWVESLKSEWKGEFDTNVKKLQSVVSTFGDAEFAALLDSTGYGDHPTLLKFLVRVADAMGEDTINRVKAGPPAQNQTAADILYPSMRPKAEI